MQQRIILASLLFVSTVICTEWFAETLHSDWQQQFKIEDILFQEKTDFQDLVIFHNDYYGNVMALDGVIQTTERDEFCYHEMLALVPLMSHGTPRNVLIIGGGDGGILREVLKYDTVEHVTHVELDWGVIELSKKYFPKHSKGAFDDERVEIIIQDGCKFVKETERRFDVIIIDSTDPIGPGEVLFTKEFYHDCHELLNDGGIMVTQASVPYEQQEEVQASYTNLKHSFKDAGFYLTVVPTYVGGFMTLGWATDNEAYRDLSIEELEVRMQHIKGELHYYTPEIHKAAFVLPGFIKKLLS